jgi:hypothetical protein
MSHPSGLFSKMDEESLLVVEAYEANERVRRDADLVRIVPTEAPCTRGCGARLQRVEHEVLQRGAVGCVLVIERCPACKVEVRTSGPVLPGMTREETRALRPTKLLAWLSRDLRTRGPRLE